MIKLLALRFLVSFRNLIEGWKVVFRYYCDWRFLRIDLYLLRSYVYKSPYKIAKQFLQARGEVEIYTYGETPLTTMNLIVQECQITANDTIYELGCGRGRACFWLHHFLKCKVIGIDYIPEFVEIAQKVKRKFNLKGITFKMEDILQANFEGASVIYFYGICSETAFVLKLIDKLTKLPKHTKIITVSYPLTTFASEQLFEIVKIFPAQFTWGTADIYLHVKI
ncbi:MAG TPA: methyltransferase domain-containing protein [Waddliaceae bacterium]